MKRTVQALTFAATVILYGGQSFAEDRLLMPLITVGEEYTDNVFDTKDNKKTDYITRLRPGFTSKYQASRFQWDAAYNLDYRYYAHRSKTDDLTHDLGLKGTIALLENLFFLDLSDTYKRVSLDIARDETVASAFANQTDQNIATINPYFMWRPGQKTVLKTGYRYIDTRYWDSNGIDKLAHSGYMDASYELTEKFSLLSNYTFTHQDSEDRQRYNKNDLSGGFRYNYAEKSFVYASAGYIWQFFSARNAARYLFWNAGLRHDFNIFTTTLETKRQNTEDPRADSTRETSYIAKIDRNFERGSLGVSGGYTEYFNSSTGTMDRRKVSVSASGKYEIMHALSASLTIGGEHYRYSTPTTNNYPYRLTGVAALTWQMLEPLSLNLSYTHVSNQYRLDSTSGGWSTNRAILETKMTF